MRKKSTLETPPKETSKDSGKVSPRNMPLVSPRGTSTAAVPLTGEEKRKRELEAEKKLQSALQTTLRAGAVPQFKPDPSKSTDENAKAKREFEGEQKLQVNILCLLMFMF
jgi:hypothetical protein